MDLKHPITTDQLEKIYVNAVNKVKRRRNHYADNKGRWRRGTRIVQALSMAGLVIGIIAPLMAKWLDKSLIKWGVGINSAEIGYIALALAGMVFALDQIFVLSSTWMRFRNAELRLNTLLDEYRFKWLRLRCSIADEAAAHENREACIVLCEELVLGSRKIVEEETAQWNNQMAAARERFGSMMKEQQAIVDKIREEDSIARQAERERALEQSSNGVAVKLKGFEQLSGCITATIGDKREERGQPVKKIIFEDIPFGQHKLVVEARYKEDERVFKWEDLIEVSNGEPKRIEIQV